MMNDTDRLTFIDRKNRRLLDELWSNVFNGRANQAHVNAHAPYPMTHSRHLDGFLTHENGYRSWLIKRKVEGDIIGFAVHGDYFPSLPNNIGFNISLTCTRQGYATETVQALLAHLRDVGLSETYGHCLETNTGSIRTMERVGFQNMGRTGTRYGGVNELRFRIEL